MKKNRFTEAQIAFALRQAESGTPVTEIIRKLGIAIDRSSGDTRPPEEVIKAFSLWEILGDGKLLFRSSRHWCLMGFRNNIAK